MSILLEICRNPAIKNLVSYNSILFHGPKGCGKTRLAKIVARESNRTFIYVNGPELLDKYVGESEKGLRELFVKARNLSPSVLLFDEIDGLFPHRGYKKEITSTEKIVTQLLTLLDGVENCKENDIMVIGTTNRLDRLDSALLRPGRFGKQIYIGLPSKEDKKVHILNFYLNKISAQIDTTRYLEDPRLKNLTCADLKDLVDRSLICALEQHLEDGLSTDNMSITSSDFQTALIKFSPSLTDEEIIFFKKWDKNID